MEIRLADPKKELENMQEMLSKYYKAAKRRRGIAPYISMYCADFNNIKMNVSNGLEDGYNARSRRYITVMVHYQNSKPSYKSSESHSKEDIRDALWPAEAKAWENYGHYKHNSKKELPIKLLHPSYAGFKGHIKANVTSFSSIQTDRLFQLLAQLNDKLKAHKDIVDSFAKMVVLVGNEVFCDSLETALIQENSRFSIILDSSAIADDLPLSRFTMENTMGGFGGYELVRKLKKDAFALAENLVYKTLLFAKAEDVYKKFKLTAGQYDAVLDGKISAVSIHELGTGHMAEANNLMTEENSGSASPFRGMLGKKIAIDDLTIMDYGALNINGVKPFSWYKYDAEGVKAEQTFMLKNGKFNSYLHTKQTAGTIPKKYGGGTLTGNARFEADDDGSFFENTPEPRMSTLYIMPSKKKCSLDDLLAQVAGRGLYIAGVPSGYVSPEESQGIVRFNEVYFVNSNCKLVPLRLKGCDLIIADDAIGFIRKIDAIGDKTTVRVDTGWCGAESGVIPHTAFGAAIKVHNLHVVPQLLEKPLKKPLIKYP